MEVITEYGNYWDLKDHSWSGALDTLADIEKADKEDELMQHLEEVFAERTPTDTEVNDYLWHDREYVYEAVGLNENGELPTCVDEAKDSEWAVILEDVDNMNESGLFETELLEHLTQKIKESQNDVYYLTFDVLDVYSTKAITEEQIQWLDDNL